MKKLMHQVLIILTGLLTTKDNNMSKSTKKIFTDNKSSVLDDMKKILEKNAVTVERENMIDTINSIMNNTKSKFSSVQAAVDDMKKRSGLTDYLKSLNEEKLQNTKTASTEEAINPQIAKTVENCVSSTKGTLPVLAVINKVKSIHSDDAPASFWDSEKFIRFVSKLNFQEKSKNYKPMENFNLGRMDTDESDDIVEKNNDAFSGMLPTKL